MSVNEANCFRLKRLEGEELRDVLVALEFTCEMCSLSKYNVNNVFDTGCEGGSEICERFDPLD